MQQLAVARLQLWRRTVRSYLVAYLHATGFPIGLKECNVLASRCVAGQAHAKSERLYMSLPTGRCSSFEAYMAALTVYFETSVVASLNLELGVVLQTLPILWNHDVDI